MKIISKSLLILIISVLGVNEIFSQKVQQRPLQLAKYGANVEAPLTAKERAQIVEVFGDQAQQMVFDRPQRLKDIKQLLRNRIEIKTVVGDYKPCPLLSEVPLFDVYVSDLKRDVVFDPQNFNILKYNIQFSYQAPLMYKVDGTNYYLIIKAPHQ